MKRISLNDDILGGIALTALAAFFLYFGWGLRLGTLTRMGPGFVPLSLAVILLGMGVVKLLMGVVREGERPVWPSLGPALLIAAVPVVFGYLIGMLGVLITVPIVALVSRLALAERLRVSDIVISLALGVFCGVVFVILLGQAMPLWPGR